MLQIIFLAEQKRKALHDEAQSAGEKKTEAQSTNARETRGAEQVAARMLSETFAPGSELVNDIQNSNNKRWKVEVLLAVAV